MNKRIIQPGQDVENPGPGPCSCTCKTPPGKAALDTLEITSEISHGKGHQNEKKQGTNVLELRRESKAISKGINGALCYQKSAIHSDYQAAYFCNDYLFQDGKKITGKFCKKRSCLICSRIYAARLFKAYSDPLLDLEDLHLVTLTAPTIKADQLKPEIEKRYKTLTEIKDLLRKTYKVKLKGIRKLEVTYNLQTKEFHPHYHLIVSTKEAADLVKMYWLKKIPEASPKAQDVRKVTSEKALFELFKYVTKSVVKSVFNAEALDQMYKSIKGVRTVQAFGIKQKTPVKIEDYEAVIIEHKAEKIDVWKWCKEKNDWYTSEGEQMNYGPVKKETRQILKTIEKHETKKGHAPERTHDIKPLDIQIRTRPKPPPPGSEKHYYWNE